MTLLAFAVCITIASYIFFDRTKLDHITFSEQNCPHSDHNQQKILIINTQRGSGGGEVYTLSLYKHLIEKGYSPTILIKTESWLEKKLRKEQLPFYMCKTFKLRFVANIKKICRAENIDIVHCNVEREVLPSKKAAEGTQTKVIFTRHLPRTQLVFKPEIMKDLDGVICVSKETQRDTHDENAEKDLGIRSIIRIPPFFEQQQFENVTSEQSKQDYFKERFGIDIQDRPVVAQIGNYADDKNQQLTLQALSILVHEKRKPVDVIFVGAGKTKHLVKQARELDVEKYAHFFGFASDTHFIRYHADIQVHPSKREAFGISVLEGAFMQKPLVGATDTGMTDIIIEGKTGLLCKNNNARSLAEKIELLINNPHYAQGLAAHARKHASETISLHVTIKQIENFYETVASTTSLT